MSVSHVMENKAQWAPAADATNAQSVPTKESTMDLSTAHSLITHAINDPARMREAMQVIKRERERIAESLDGGVASAAAAKPAPSSPEHKIKWNGLVRANEFESKVGPPLF